MVVKMLIAPPRRGKSYNGTRLALKAIQRGRKVFSNYPIITPDGKLCSREWKDEYSRGVVLDSDIFIDESYRGELNSTKYADFPEDVHLFFSTCGHNGNNIWLLTQNEARIVKAVREVVDEFYIVKKCSIPLLGRLFGFPDGDIPIFFTLTVYGSLEDLKAKNVKKGQAAKEFHFFSPYVAASYDTHYFRGSEKPVEGVPWLNKVKCDMSNNPKVQKNLLSYLAVQGYRKFTKRYSNIRFIGILRRISNVRREFMKKAKSLFSEFLRRISNVRR